MPHGVVEGVAVDEYDGCAGAGVFVMELNSPYGELWHLRTKLGRGGGIKQKQNGRFGVDQIRAPGGETILMYALFGLFLFSLLVL